MRQLTVLLTTITFSLSGLVASPASTTEIRQVVASTVASAVVANPATPIPAESAGNCVAAGQFKEPAGSYQAFTQTQSNGSWALAIPAVFGAGVQSTTSPYARFYSVSCSSAGNCVAAGEFRAAAGSRQAFTQTQSNGSWALAIPAAFAAGVQNTNPYAYFSSVSCSSAGNCVAAGQFKEPAGFTQPFTQTQSNGSWALATPAAFGAGVQSTTSPYSSFYSVSCSSAGNCVAAGEFRDAAGSRQAFTQSITEAIEVPVVTPAPNIATPNTSGAMTTSTTTKLPTFYISASKLTKSQKAALKKVASKAGLNATFVIIGTAGKLPGVTDQSVKALAKKRGQIAKAYLVKLGISKANIKIQVKITNQGIVPKTKILAKYLVSQ